jgi:nicotinate-nucleotide adenylyltransferase
MNIGIVGGTFDPFHHGHLEPVLASRETMQWDRILYVPAHRQPFKLTNDSTPDWHRYAMLILATLDLEDVYASDVELLRGDVSYTVDTLEQVRTQYPDATLDWIIGDDNLATLDDWRNVDRIFELANFAVLSRHVAPPPASRDAAEGDGATWKHHMLHDPRERKTHGSIVFTHNATVPISATDIRNRVRAGQSIDAFVDPRVSRYIAHYGLYKGTT